MKHTYMETRADDRKLTKHDKNETMCLHPTCRYALVADPLCGCTIHTLTARGFTPFTWILSKHVYPLVI